MAALHTQLYSSVAESSVLKLHVRFYFHFSLFLRSFKKVVPTTKREARAVWGAVNPLFESKTLAGGGQEMDLPEERIDTERGFEFRKIFYMFKVGLTTPVMPLLLLFFEKKFFPLFLLNLSLALSRMNLGSSSSSQS